MLNVIIEEKLYEADFVANWTAGFEQLRDHVHRFTPEWASEITDIPAGQIRELAEMYALTKSALIHEGNAFANHTNVVQAVRAIGCLKAITGNLDIAGGNVCFPNVVGYPVQVEQGTPTGIKTSVNPSAPHLAVERYPLLPAGSPAGVDALVTGKPYQPRALMIYHSNPLMSNTNYNRLKGALKKLEFIVAFDIFMTRTVEEVLAFWSL